MNCIFCKNDSTNSRSVEHILPESLGNKEHTLPKGVVCDSCNNYFATKIERPFLEQPFFRSLRSRNLIEGKRNRIPTEKAITMGGQVEILPTKDGLSVIYEDERIIKKVIAAKSGRIYVPQYSNPEPNNNTISRFLGKVAIEFMTSRVLQIEGWNEEIVTKEQLDLLRNYVRYGSGPSIWQYNERRIYSEDQRFVDPSNGRVVPYQVLHEMDLIYTENLEMFLVLAIMGLEFAINLANPSIRTYENWLKENNYKSILDLNESRKKL